MTFTEFMSIYISYYLFLNMGVIIYSFVDPEVYISFPETWRRIVFRTFLFFLGVPLILSALARAGKGN